MKRYAIGLCAALLASPAVSSEAPFMYVLGSFGKSETGLNYQSDFFLSPTAKSSESLSSYGVALGATFFPFLSAEIGYESLGSFSVEGTTQSTIPVFDGYTEQDFDATRLVVKLKQAFLDDFNVHVLGGVYRSSVNYTYSQTRTDPSDPVVSPRYSDLDLSGSYSVSGVVVGVGGEYQVMSSLFLGVEFKSYLDLIKQSAFKDRTLSHMNTTQITLKKQF